MLARLRRKSAVAARMNGPQQCFETMTTLLTADGKKRSNFQHICYYHLLKVGGFLNLMVNKLRAAELQHRLRVCYEHRNTWENFLTDRGYCHWFRLGGRPRQPEDVRGVFAFDQTRTEFVPLLSAQRARAIVDEIGGDGTWEHWTREGTLILPDMFAWLWDGVTWDGVTEEGIGAFIQAEFDLYLHHQTARNGKDNFGWLRTMVHSLSQQIIRQDIAYWQLYVCLRPDRNHRLVSFPYYTKYAVASDETAFAHLDLKVSSYLEDGRGANIIQGSVSFDHETNRHCTVLIPGFQRHLEAWWAQVRARGPEPNGLVTGLEKIWAPEDAKSFGDFVRVPCPRGGVRISRPELPHGSTANEDGSTRRTILPWFVGVSEDGQTLDNTESDTWRELSFSHITQTAPRNSPSGWTNRYGAIPYRFAASTHLQLENPISDALVCRTLWEDPRVQKAALLMLGSDREKARDMVQRHRLNALRSFRQAFRTMVTAEMELFGPHSYFGGMS